MPTNSVERPDIPGVIAPPPFIFIGFLLAGWLVERFVVGDLAMPIPDLWRRWIAVGLIALGLIVEAAAAMRFHKAKTAIEPWKPSTTLLTHGLYGRTRNPIYLGFAITYLGIALGLESPLAILMLIPCLVVIDRGVIAREEVYLERKFGESYRAYRRSVRRWL